MGEMTSIDIILAALVAFLLVILAGVLWIERRDQAKLREKLKLAHIQRVQACVALEKSEQEKAGLVAELSKTRNTLALATAEETKKASHEPIKAKTSADVRKAVERRNLQEMEQHG